jgi:sporulation protein YlmC with PRC-barrel domain
LGCEIQNGEKIGSVEELILDTQAKKVRYMVVDLDENELRLEHRKIVIPIGFAELDSRTDDVLIPNVSVDSFVVYRTIKEMH